MEQKGVTFCVQAFGTEAAAITFTGSLDKVTAAFRESLEKRLQKKGMAPAATGSASVPAQVEISGRFVRVDEGNRWLRYLLTFFAGHAIVEVEGEAKLTGNKIADLHHVAKQAGGFFGGGGESLLVLCARSCGNTFADRVIKAIRAM